MTAARFIAGAAIGVLLGFAFMLGRRRMGAPRRFYD